MSISSIRVKVAEARFKRALSDLRWAFPIGLAAQEEGFDRVLSAVEQAARTLAVEHGHWSWLKAAESYGVADVTALTDWELERDRAAATP